MDGLVFLGFFAGAETPRHGGEAYRKDRSVHEGVCRRGPPGDPHRGKVSGRHDQGGRGHPAHDGEWEREQTSRAGLIEGRPEPLFGAAPFAASPLFSSRSYRPGRKKAADGGTPAARRLIGGPADEPENGRKQTAPR